MKPVSRLFFLFILIFIALWLCQPIGFRAQTNSDLANDTRVSWLKERALRIRTIDPADDDFRDLAPFKQTLRHAGIVMLGESSHGDGATFLAKTRLVKFLHKEMGFDVLVFESGLYDMTKVWEAFKKGEHSLEVIRLGVVPVWGGSDQTADLFNYIATNAATKHPLELVGWDNQITGSASQKYLVSDLRAFLQSSGIDQEFLIDGGDFKAILDNLFSFSYWRGTPVPTVEQQAAYFDRLERLEREIKARANKNDAAGFWVQVIHSLRVSTTDVWLKQKHDETLSAPLDEAREKQGAENLLWLADRRYRGRKIIVWSATWHVIRNKGLEPSQCVKPEDVLYCRRVALGQYIYDCYGEKAYVIGFTSYGGNSGFIRNGKAEPGSGPIRTDQHPSIEVEELFNIAGVKYSYVDLRTKKPGSDWLRSPMRARLLGNSAGLRNWSKALDGVFFIREQQFNSR